MVEINNQRGRRSSICWRGRRETDNGRQKNQKSWLWRHCRRRAIYRLLRSPRQTCQLNPKLKSTGAGRYQLLLLVDAYCKQFGPKDFSPKSQDAVALQQIKERRFTHDWSWWYPSGNRLLQQYLGQLPGAGYGQFEHKVSLIAKIQSSGRNGQRDWCMSRVTAIISALVICIIVCLSWAVNHYRDNAIT